MKKENRNIIFLVIAAIAFFAFKKPGKKGSSLIPFPDTNLQENVFSKVGTVVYNDNMNPIYTYDTEGLGMKVLQFAGTFVNVQFDTNKTGFVYYNQIILP